MICTLLTGVVVFGTEIPLGIPSQWTWQRSDLAEFPWFELGGAVLVFTFAAAIAVIMDNATSRNAGTKHLWLGLPLIFVLLGIMDVQVLKAGRSGAVENVYALLDPYATGYLAEAASIEEPGHYFSAYEDKLENIDQDVHHVDVHPPGNVAMAYGVWQLCRTYPALGNALVKWLPTEVRTGLEKAQQHRFFGGRTLTEGYYSAACMLLVLFLFLLLSGQLLLLLAGLQLTNAYQNTGVTACCLAAVPGVIFFLGMFGVVYFFLTSAALACLAGGVCSGRRSCSAIWVGACGFVCGVGVLFSLAFGTIIALFAVVLLIRAVHNRWERSHLIWFPVGGFAVVAGCYAVGVDIIEICRTCLSNNSLFYMQTERSWHWMLINPVEFAVFLGVLWAGIIVWRLRELRTLRQVFHCDFTQVLRFAMVLFFCVLLVHPYTRGEFARLGLFFMPVPLALGCVDLLKERFTLRSRIVLLCAAGTILVQTVMLRAGLKLWANM